MLICQKENPNKFQIRRHSPKTAPQLENIPWWGKNTLEGAKYTKYNKLFKKLQGQDCCLDPLLRACFKTVASYGYDAYHNISQATN